MPTLVLAALVSAVAGVLAMSPSSLIVVIIVKRLGGGFLAGLAWSILINLLIAAGSVVIFIFARVPYEPWQPAFAIGAAVITAAIWNVLAFVVFRR